MATSASAYVGRLRNRKERRDDVEPDQGASKSSPFAGDQDLPRASNMRLRAMPSGVQIIGFNVDELRARLTKMSDEKLQESGEAACYMVSPK
jgi:hypothetical protein